MPDTVPEPDDEAQIRALIERRANALRTKNATETLSTQTEDFAQYPLTSVLEHTAAKPMAKEDFEAVFAGIDGPVSYETLAVDVKAGDRVAVSNSLARINADLVGGAQLDMWFRKTLVFEKTNGTWLISLEHESVPLSSDGTGRAATELQPDSA